MKRETAWRVFAGEFNDSKVEIKGEGEKAPSYVVTPLGAKINRLFIVGVLTDVESISEGGEFIRAHVSDPTGVFTLYSGKFQKEVTDILNNIDVPVFVAVVGKVRTFSPEEGTIYVSVRPEKIMEVNADVRDKWVIETCKNTKDRIEAVFEAMKMEDRSAFKLYKLGYSRELAEGVIIALERYGNIDLNRYIALIQESLQYLSTGKERFPDINIQKKIDKKREEIEKEEAKKIKIEEIESEETSEDFADVENAVLEIIKEIEGGEGASWDEVVERCEKEGINKDTVEEALSSLMDKGLIYEPVLGVLKTT